MAIKIEFDQAYNAIEPSFLLAKRNGSLMGYIPATDIHVIVGMQMQEASFCIHKYDNGKKCALWDQIKDFRLVYCPEWDLWFEITVELNENDDTIKDVSAISLGNAELSQIKLFGIEINTEADIARDDYVPTVLFNELNPEASLLNRILGKAPHYKIEHVDASVAGIQRTFTFDSIALTDAFQEIGQEINCLIQINSNTDADGKIARSISVYDLGTEAYCIECKHRGDFKHACPECGSTEIITGYGKDTSIYISAENLADEIKYSVDAGSVKNCFKLEAGDELMTATIINCNPNGSGYIWYISDAMREDMSAELKDRLTLYDEQYAYYQNEHAIDFDDNLVATYNSLVEKYSDYRDDLSPISEPVVGYAKLMNAYFDTIDFRSYLQNEMMPDSALKETTASEQVSLLNSTTLLSPVAVSNIESCSKSTATSAVLAIAKTIVDPRYQVKTNNEEYTGNVWQGSFIIKSYADEDDISETDIIKVSITDDYSRYVEQRIQKSISDGAKDASGISALANLELDKFASTIEKYCLASLNAFADVFQTCNDILIEQGAANAKEWENIDGDGNLYENLYTPYRLRLKALQAEIKVREAEISVIAGIYDADGYLETEGLQTKILAESYRIQNDLNMENFLGAELWREFSAFRREDTYLNTNYISDGLSNKELFSRCLEFIDVAKEEIIKSATRQHSITASLKNLLTMREFAPIVDQFEAGNWLRLNADDSVYRLRLIQYEIHFSDLDSLNVVFSDVIQGVDAASDAQSILKQASSMATSYDAVTRQASQGKEGKDILEGWVADGLALTKMKIIDSAIDQNVTWDNHGILCRQYLPITESYDDKQLKIINRGLYLTDDNWETSKAGIGDFSYYDPKDGKMKDAYGVIAETLVGNLILSENVGIYNTSNSIVLDEHGVLVTTKPTVEDNSSIFTIRKTLADENGVETYDDVFHVTNNGDLYMEGIVYARDGEFTGTIYANNGEFAGKLNAATGTFSGELTAAKGTFNGVFAGTLNAENIMVDDGSGVLITMGEQISNNIDVRNSAVLTNKINMWFDFNDELGLVVQKPGSTWSTVTDNVGYHIKNDNLVEYVGSFARDRLIVQNVQIGAGIIKRTSTGGFAFQCDSNASST